MDPKLLEEAGLTEGESKVYLALLKLGTIKTGPLAKEAEVSSSKVYKILDRLMKKGLVGHVIRGKIKYFTAMSPKRVLEYMEEKEKQLEKKKQTIKELIPQLEQEQLTKETQAVIFDGFKACTNFFRSIIDDLRKDETYYVIGAGYGDVPGLREFFHQHHMRRAKKGIKLKMLANFDTKQNIEPPTKKKAEIRYLPQYLITNMEIVFYKNKVFIVLWTKQPTGFLIKNEEAIKSFQSYFNAFWKIAKKE